MTNTNNGTLFSLGGQAALVTGASSGIGRRAALALAKAGATVVCLARRAELLEEVQAEIQADVGLDRPVYVLPCDLGAIKNVEDWSKLAQQVAGLSGPVSILLNAAGVNPRKHADEVTPEQWQETLDLNLSAPFFLAQALVPHMRINGQGSIINFASLQSYRAFENGIAYGASKGGVAQLTRAMAEAWSKDGIRANAIAPGFFPTELTAPVFGNSDTANHHAKATAIGRNGTLEDLDGPLVFLASPASAYVTGQILAVDGGYLAK